MVAISKLSHLIGRTFVTACLAAEEVWRGDREVRAPWSTACWSRGWAAADREQRSGETPGALGRYNLNPGLALFINPNQTLIVYKI